MKHGQIFNIQRYERMGSVCVSPNSLDFYIKILKPKEVKRKEHAQGYYYELTN